MQKNTTHTADRYSKSADRYESRWHRYLHHTHQYFLKQLQTDTDDIILDASCGTGLLAEQFIKKEYPFKKLVLNDIASGMQQKAEKRLQGCSAVSFSQQPVQLLDFEDNLFSKVLCLSAFHNYTKQQKVIENFRTVLQPGGKLYLLDWNSSGWFSPINWLIDRCTSEYIDSRSLEEISELLSAARFDLVQQEEWSFRYWKFYCVIAQKPPC